MKESYQAQNSLELKLPSRSSPSFDTEQRTFYPKKGMNMKIGYGSAPSRSVSGWSQKFLAPVVES